MRATSLPLPASLEDPVLRVVVERALAGSRRGERSDQARVALAIEGGGMAGAVSGGMCAALEALGLIDSFDRIYGTSAGALNASYTAAGEARLRRELYLLAARRRLICPSSAIRGRPPVRLGELLDLVLNSYPHGPEVLDPGCPLRVTAVRVDDKRLDLLSDFSSLAELRQAVRASCSIPVLTGELVEFRGRHYADGALIESIPYRVAVADGATHVLVLRTRPADYRKRELRGARRRALDCLLARAPETVAEMFHERAEHYNSEAAALERPEAAGLGGRVTQLAPPAEAPRTSQLERRPRRLLAALALGARTAYRALAVTPDPAVARGGP